MWHTGTGKIVYDPFRGKMKKRTAWWCVLEVDKEITRYYRWWIEKELHIHSLVQPAWDAHISIIRGEEPADNLKHLWKKYHGQKVEFKYGHVPERIEEKPNRKSTDIVWAIKVRSPFLLSIRDELGRPSDWGLHLTVGKENY